MREFLDRAEAALTRSYSDNHDLKIALMSIASGSWAGREQEIARRVLDGESVDFVHGMSAPATQRTGFEFTQPSERFTPISRS